LLRDVRSTRRRLALARPQHFEIPVDDPDRAEAFYSAVFGWTFERFPGAPQYYGLAHTGDEQPGIDGALFQRQPDAVTSITMGVDSIEGAVARVKGNGGSVLQDKSPIPGVGWFANCKDSEGNLIGLFTNDPNPA
jgi:uncharacterized protein